MTGFLRRGSVAAGLFAIAGGAAGGCNFIVGAGDYAVGGDASTQASGSEGGGGATEAGPGGEDAGGDGVGGGHGGGDAAGSDGGHVPKPDAGGRLGDPCSTNAQCTAGTCGGLWCTQACTTNAVCGMNSSGEPNYCVQNANNELVCVPGCTTSTDCQEYPGATCTPIAGVAESICKMPTAGADGGSTGIGVGDPCSTMNAPCGQGGDSCNGAWCVASCTSGSDTSCGSNSLGVSNYCVENVKNAFICFPGCSTNADCTPISGTTCQPIIGNTVDSICAGTSGNIGDPCSTATTSPWNACTHGTCQGTWCSTTCSSSADTSCGSNTAGVANQCVENGNKTFSCFPGCSSGNDCAPYAGAFCLPIAGGAAAVCAVSGGQVGDPCSTDSDCTQAGATCAGSWCSQPCSSPTDATCGTNSEGNTNYCVQDSTTQKYLCFPGCTTDTDCTPYQGATCFSTGTGTQEVCSF